MGEKEVDSKITNTNKSINGVKIIGQLKDFEIDFTNVAKKRLIESNKEFFEQKKHLPVLEELPEKSFETIKSLLGKNGDVYVYSRYLSRWDKNGQYFWLKKQH